jgi:hypothetical protein
MSYLYKNYSTVADYLPSDDYLYDLGFNYILTSYKNRAPDRLLQNGRSNDRKAAHWLSDDGLLTRLQAVNPDVPLKHFVIDLERGLGLSYGLTALFDYRQAEHIKTVLREKMRGQYFFAKLEQGKQGRLHLHLLAFECPILPKGGQKVREIRKLAAYLAKPAMCLPNRAESYTRNVCIKLGTYLWLQKMQERRCPNLTFNHIPRA